MADVRLTATNPENSQAVPVACNSKGELLLEQPEGGDTAVQLDDGGTKQVIKSAGLGISDGSTVNIQLQPDGSATFGGPIEAETSFFETEIATDGAIHIKNIGDDNFTAVIQGDGKAYTMGDLNVGTPGNPQDSRIGMSAPTGKARMAIKDETINSWWGVSNFADNFQIQRWDGVSWKAVTSTNGTGALTHNGTASFTSDVVVGSRGKQWMIVESNGIAHMVEQTFREEINGMKEPSEQVYPNLRNIPGELTMIEEQLQKVMEFLRMAPQAGWEVWDGSD
jgi:hypothetical protein